MAQELLPGAPADPSTFRQEVERLRKAEAELASLRPREAKLQTALAEKNLENLELRWRVAAAREATHPSLAQVHTNTTHYGLQSHHGCNPVIKLYMPNPLYRHCSSLELQDRENHVALSDCVCCCTMWPQTSTSLHATP